MLKSLLSSRSSLGLFRQAAVAAALVFLVSSWVRTANAQATWEYSPYEIRVWIAMPHDAAFTPALRAEMATAIQSGCRGSAGYAWNVKVADAPAALQADLLYRLDQLAPKQIKAVDRSFLDGDKLVAVVVDQAEGGYTVRVRELDLLTRLWSDTLRFTTGQRDAVPQIAASAVVDVVRPLAKIEKVEGRTVQARLRAGGLIDNETPSAAIAAGAILQPVVRRNARNGEPLPNGIFAPPWSYVAIDNQEASILKGTIHSGYASVIPVKGGARTERLLLGLKPRYTTTRLQLRARAVAAGSRGGPPTVGRPLAGYEVFVKYPGEENTELVGLTNWQGTIELEPSDKPLQLFYIRNGGQLLARLPLVVGQQAEITANVIDDNPRLLAETYIKAMQSRVMDLVARREILAVRIRAKLKKREYADAQQLVEEFRRLPGRSQLLRELEETHRRMSGVPGLTGRRIDKLFQDGQRLLAKFLDPSTADQLAQEVAEAQKGTSGKSPAESSTVPATTPTT
jgi:hypothetical protein